MALIPYSLSAVLMAIIYFLIFVLFYGKLKNRHKKTEEVYREDNSNKDYNEVKVIEINPEDDKIEEGDIKVIELTPENNDPDKK